MNYSEPEELTIGISELDDIENKIDLEVISKEINRRDKLEDIARIEGLTERQIRYLLDKIKN